MILSPSCSARGSVFHWVSVRILRLPGDSPITLAKRTSFFQCSSVDICAVGTSYIFEHPLFPIPLNLSMFFRDLRVFHVQVTPGGPSYCNPTSPLFVEFRSLHGSTNNAKTNNVRCRHLVLCLQGHMSVHRCVLPVSLWSNVGLCGFAASMVAGSPSRPAHSNFGTQLTLPFAKACGSFLRSSLARTSWSAGTKELPASRRVATDALRPIGRTSQDLFSALTFLPHPFFARFASFEAQHGRACGFRTNRQCTCGLPPVSHWDVHPTVGAKGRGAFLPGGEKPGTF